MVRGMNTRTEKEFGEMSGSRSWTIWGLLKLTYKEWMKDHATRLAAGVAYYATFSIAPLLIIAIALIGLIYGNQAASDELRPQLTQFLGAKPAEFVQGLVAQIGHRTSLSMAGILSIVLILYAATNLFVALQDALNTIFNVVPKPNRGIKGVLADRALSFVMVLFLGVLILVSVMLSTFLSAVEGRMPADMVSPFMVQGLTIAGNIVLFTIAFAALFKYLPDVKIQWRDTLLGAGLTSLVFTVARTALGYYLGRASTTGPFGAAGSLVAIMLFIYYSTMIMFLGAEFTQVWVQRNGEALMPSDNAIAIPDIPHPK